MSEWSIEHARKTIPATLTNALLNTSQRNRFNDLQFPVAPRCDAVNVDILPQFRPDLTQFLHSLPIQLFAYYAMLLDVLRTLIEPTRMVVNGACP
jgi:hypothetical protein